MCDKRSRGRRTPVPSTGASDPGQGSHQACPSLRAAGTGARGAREAVCRQGSSLRSQQKSQTRKAPSDPRPAPRDPWAQTDRKVRRAVTSVHGDMAWSTRSCRGNWSVCRLITTLMSPVNHQRHLVPRRRLRPPPHSHWGGRGSPGQFSHLSLEKSKVTLR